MAEVLPAIVSGLNDWDSFEEGYLRDPTIRDYGPGRNLARPGCEPLTKWWRYTRVALTTTDKEIWDTWQGTTVQIGGVPFTWTDPRPSGTNHTVRLGGEIVFRPTRHKKGYYNADLYLIEEANY